ncbi:SHOCT domain-containing protein, partial [Streptococcus pyogenes]
APADTIEDRLRELARLRDIGAITPEDYETRKREMLSEL